MQTTTAILRGTLKYLKKIGKKERWVHLLLWLMPFCVVNIPVFEFTLGVFHGGNYSLLAPSIYGLVLNALIFYDVT